MTIPSSRSLILWISVFSITSPSADFGRLRKTSDVFGRLRTPSGIFGNDRVVFKNPSTPRIKISRLHLRKSWQVYYHRFRCAHQAFKQHKARVCACHTLQTGCSPHLKKKYFQPPGSNNYLAKLHNPLTARGSEKKNNNNNNNKKT